MKQLIYKEIPPQVTPLGDGLYKITFGVKESVEGYIGWEQIILTKELTNEKIKKLLDKSIVNWTDNQILKGMIWEGHQIWLSMENQMNYFKSQETANRTLGSNLPVSIKVENDEVIDIDTLEKLNEFTDAIEKHIQDTLHNSWSLREEIKNTSFIL